MPRLTYESIQKQIEKLQAQAKKLEASHHSKKLKSVTQVRALMKRLNVSITDLDIPSQDEKSKGKNRKSGASRATSAVKPKRATVAPKYRHPETMQTWTGRGKAPVWLASLIAQGHSKEDFLIQTSTPDEKSFADANETISLPAQAH